MNVREMIDNTHALVAKAAEIYGAIKQAEDCFEYWNNKSARIPADFVVDYFDFDPTDSTVDFGFEVLDDEWIECRAYATYYDDESTFIVPAAYFHMTSEEIINDFYKRIEEVVNGEKQKVIKF